MGKAVGFKVGIGVGAPGMYVGAIEGEKVGVEVGPGRTITVGVVP